MFGHYNIKFKDNSEFRLSGEDYFGDRVEFSRSHNASLLRFALEICEKGRPQSLYSSYEDKMIIFDSDKEFDEWYLKNQSPIIDFGFSDVKTIKEFDIEINKRIKIIKNIFIEEIRKLRIYAFYDRYYYERYNKLFKELKISLKSIEVLMSKNLFDLDKLKKLKVLFESPFLEIKGKESLEFYNKTWKKTISQEEMRKLIEAHYALFMEKINGQSKS